MPTHGQHTVSTSASSIWEVPSPLGAFALAPSVLCALESRVTELRRAVVGGDESRRGMHDQRDRCKAPVQFRFTHLSRRC